MAEIVNLRRARKTKKRAEHETAAAANRARFGVPKSARDLTKAEEDIAAHKHEQHRIGKRDDDTA
ncbi:MAG: DUF4169 family protein [Rhizomicrobium sp.]|jgi:hypothetical protein